jgi:lipoprotein-anchoring transpeptidase ErfK/SrfK
MRVRLLTIVTIPVAAATLMAGQGLASASTGAHHTSANRPSTSRPAARPAAAGHAVASRPARAHRQAHAAASYRPARRTLSYGSRSEDVRRLQRRLDALHYYPGSRNGVFDMWTLEAVWAFQEVQGIPATGVVGHETERALVHPRMPRALVPHGGAERVEIDLGRHVLYVYRHNRVVLISHVSTGGGYYFCSPGGGCGYAVTPTGNFRTRGFMRGWVRVPLGSMYNPVFFIGTAYAIHGESYVPLAPVSHGCVRIPMDVADFFHRLVKTTGTPVYIRN